MREHINPFPLKEPTVYHSDKSTMQVYIREKRRQRRRNRQEKARDSPDKAGMSARWREMAETRGTSRLTKREHTNELTACNISPGKNKVSPGLRIPRQAYCFRTPLGRCWKKASNTSSDQIGMCGTKSILRVSTTRVIEMQGSRGRKVETYDSRERINGRNRREPKKERKPVAV